LEHCRCISTLLKEEWCSLGHNLVAGWWNFKHSMPGIHMTGYSGEILQFSKVSDRICTHLNKKRPTRSNSHMGHLGTNELQVHTI
jgi:hypothetical protein